MSFYRERRLAVPSLLMRRLAAVLAAALLAGCGNKPATSESAKGQSEAPQPGDSADAPPNEHKTANRKKKPSGKKVGDIPLDAWPEVWFQDPLSIASEKGALEARPAPRAGETEKPVAEGAPAATTEGSKGGAGASAATGGDSSWGALIGGEDILDETKAIRNSLTQKLQDVGRYSSTYKELRIDASVLTVLAGISTEHPDAPSWKANAKYIRDAASDVAKASTANGEKFFKPARKAYDKLDALFSGSKPPDVEESADKVKFSEVANRYYLMERMRRTTNWMKSEVNSETAFKKEAAKVAHEAAILALLAKVIETPDYPDADIDEYRGYADSVSRSGLDIGQAVKNGDFKAFTSALDQCQKSCDKCHQEFKNG